MSLVATRTHRPETITMMESTKNVGALPSIRQVFPEFQFQPQVPPAALKPSESSTSIVGSRSGCTRGKWLVENDKIEAWMQMTRLSYAPNMKRAPRSLRPPMQSVPENHALPPTRNPLRLQRQPPCHLLYPSGTAPQQRQPAIPPDVQSRRREYKSHVVELSTPVSRPRTIRACKRCGVTETRLWRTSPNGGSLCNRCGLRRRKTELAYKAKMQPLSERRDLDVNVLGTTFPWMFP